MFAGERAAEFEDQIGNLLGNRSEEHTSELQSQLNLVCRLLLEKKKDAAERGDRVDLTNPRVRAVVREHIISVGSPGTAVVEYDIVIPDQESPFALRRLVAVNVL